MYFPKGISQEAIHKVKVTWRWRSPKKKEDAVVRCKYPSTKLLQKVEKERVHPFAVPLSLHNFCVLTPSYNHHVLAGEVGSEFAKVGTTCTVNVLTPSGLNLKSFFFSPSEFPQVFLSVCPTGPDNA